MMQYFAKTVVNPNNLHSYAAIDYFAAMLITCATKSDHFAVACIVDRPRWKPINFADLHLLIGCSQQIVSSGCSSQFGFHYKKGAHFQVHPTYSADNSDKSWAIQDDESDHFIVDNKAFELLGVFG